MFDNEYKKYKVVAYKRFENVKEVLQLLQIQRVTETITILTWEMSIMQIIRVNY